MSNFINAQHQASSCWLGFGPWPSILLSPTDSCWIWATHGHPTSGNNCTTRVGQDDCLNDGPLWGHGSKEFPCTACNGNTIDWYRLILQTSNPQPCYILLYPAIIPVPSCPINPPSMPNPGLPEFRGWPRLVDSWGVSSLPLQHDPPANKCTVMILKVTRILLAIVGARLLLATVSGSFFLNRFHHVHHTGT